MMFARITAGNRSKAGHSLKSFIEQPPLKAPYEAALVPRKSFFRTNDSGSTLGYPEFPQIVTNGNFVVGHGANNRKARGLVVLENSNRSMVTHEILYGLFSRMT
jgi:hypothetical protein